MILIQLLYIFISAKVSKKEKRNKSQKCDKGFLVNICVRFCTDLYCGLDFTSQFRRAVVKISTISDFSG